MLIVSFLIFKQNSKTKISQQLYFEILEKNAIGLIRYNFQNFKITLWRFAQRTAIGFG
jgi:hypothetical protein